MKAKDLMIGDWMKWNDKYYCKISFLSSFGNNLGISYKEDKYALWTHTEGNASEVRPIPLTKEILMKNGFDLGESNATYIYEDYKSKKKVIVYFDYEELKVVCDISILFDYRYNDTICVHELQHALKLCKIEKEIVL